MKSLRYLIIFMLCAGLGGYALAKSDEAEMLKKAKISLIEAIKLAESHQGGEAIEAEIEDDSFQPEFEVKILKDNQEFEVTVDGISGEIKRVKQK